MAAPPVPTFYLYGEPHRSVDSDFVHVEALDDRSRPSEWTIRPHAHAELSHLFLIGTGGGTMRVDGRDLAFDAPAMLVVPATCVHGFTWADESTGWVATLAQAELGELERGDAEITSLFAASRVAPLTPDEAAAAASFMAALARELHWSAPGRRAATRATLLSLAVLALRGALVAPSAFAPPGQHAALLARFRERIEQRFRLREPVQDHAAALGVSQSALRTACARVARLSPAALIDQRAITEAQRALVYSNLSVAQVGYSLGFGDPAYFSRFFARHTGRSPRAYRTHVGRGQRVADGAGGPGEPDDGKPADRLG